MFIYWMVLFRYLNKNSYAEKYYICIPRNTKRLGCSIYLPLLLMAVVNVIIFINKYCNSGTNINKQDIHMLDVYNMLTIFLLTISSVIGEEVIFRGILLSEFCRYCKTWSAVVSTSFIFACMHIVNFFSGEALAYTLIQILNAGAIGFCMAVVSLQQHSIFYGIVIHSVINISSLFMDNTFFLSDLNWKIFLILPMLYIIYGIYLYQKGKNRTRI